MSQPTPPSTPQPTPRSSVRFGRVDWPAWFAPWTTVIVAVQARIQDGRRRMREDPDAGYTTETVLVTALLIALAIGVIAIIAAKITEKANTINLG